MVELAGGGGYRFPSGISVRIRTESVGPIALVRRIVERLRERRRGRVGNVCDRIGNLGIDPDAAHTAA